MENSAISTFPPKKKKRKSRSFSNFRSQPREPRILESAPSHRGKLKAISPLSRWVRREGGPFHYREKSARLAGKIDHRKDDDACGLWPGLKARPSGQFLSNQSGPRFSLPSRYIFSANLGSRSPSAPLFVSVVPSRDGWWCTRRGSFVNFVRYNITLSKVLGQRLS